MKKIIPLLFIILLFSTACDKEDFFELERSPEIPYLTVDEFERAPIGCYSWLFYGGWGAGYDYWLLYLNAVGDDVGWADEGDATWGWYRDTENQKAWLGELFTKAYKVIATANDALAFVEENDGNPFPELSDDDITYNLNRIVGELYFIRGFAYYMLATTFCDAYVPGGANTGQQIALRTERCDSYEEAANGTIGTTEQIWQQILSDFTTAYGLLPERYTSIMHSSYAAGRANKFAAAAMMCRTYFAMGDYDNAGTYADFVIEENDGDYDLTEDPIEAYNKITMSRAKEVIMYIPCYDQTFGGRHLHAGCFNHHFLANINSWTAPFWDPSSLQRIGWMEDPKNDTTITIIARRDKRFQQVSGIREAYNAEYAGTTVDGHYYENSESVTYRTIWSDRFFQGNNNGYTNVPQIRLAEMYLTRSICRYKDGNKQGAADDLNVVRARSWDADVAGETYASSDNYVTSSNITEQMIGDERMIEMFMEADRINYLRGMKDEAISDGERGTGNVSYTDKGFAWPVPLKETDLNNAYGE